MRRTVFSEHSSIQGPVLSIHFDWISRTRTIGTDIRSVTADCPHWECPSRNLSDFDGPETVDEMLRTGETPPPLRFRWSALLEGEGEYGVFIMGRFIQVQ